MINNNVIISGEQQKDSAIHTPVDVVTLSSMVKTLCFQGRECGFNPGSGN